MKGRRPNKDVAIRLISECLDIRKNLMDIYEPGDGTFTGDIKTISDIIYLIYDEIFFEALSETFKGKKVKNKQVKAIKDVKNNLKTILEKRLKWK